MKFLKLHLAEAAVAVLFVIVVAFFFQKHGEGTADDGNITYNENWFCITDDGIEMYPKLPERIQIPDGHKEEVILSKQLEQNIVSVNSVGFYTSHQEVTAFVDGRRIYEKKAAVYEKSKTPGNCWNFIQILEEYEGKVLEIHLKNCYDYGNVKIPEIFYGPQSTVVVQQLNAKVLPLLVGISMLIVGLMLVISWCTIGKKMHFHEGIQWLGLFTIHFAVWSAMETQVPALMVGRELLCNRITFMSLQLMILPIVCFIRVVYQVKGSKVWQIFAWLGILNFMVTFVLQFFGWADYRETIWMTHLLGTAVILAALIHGCKILIERRKQIFRSKRKVWMNIGGICVVGACMLMDALNYYYRFYEDVATFSRIGCLIFILILTVEFLEDSMDLIEVGRQAETIKEEAEMDGLTMLKNRRTFEMDLHRIPEEKYGKYAIVIFDLNNLKKMNDVHGHGMGDYYIIVGSEIIQDVFGEFGEIYRIGGDEFCLISERMSRQIYEEKAKYMCEWMNSLEGIQLKELMQIASGFAIFDKNEDGNLQDTMSRADKQMYQCKKRQKEQMA